MGIPDTRPWEAASGKSQIEGGGRMAVREREAPSEARSNHRPAGISEARRALANCLRMRTPELEAAMLVRMYSIHDSSETDDPEYARGLRASLRVALDYALLGIEGGEDRVPSVPVALTAQARMAARNGIGLDTVLRRYLAGYTLLTDCAIEAAEEAGSIEHSVLQKILRDHAAVLDRLLAAVSEEHGREESERTSSNEKRRAERVTRLLAGEPVDPSPLNYSLGGTHIGLVAKGPRAADLARTLADRFDKRLLRVRCDEMTVWAWLGSSAPPQPDEVANMLENVLSLCGDTVVAALGEPGSGPTGWRLTHRQSQTALCAVDSEKLVASRYRDVALIASIQNDSLLAASLRTIYLNPLAGERHEVLRQALKAYFAASRNVSSAAAMLGVKRHTVTKRLRIAEERLGFGISDFPLELEAALRLEDVESPSSMAPAASGCGHNGPTGN